ncbi:MAG: 3-terminal-phosphate cyclase [Myxococcales bacterium]|nr:3-terminal-phosphate cyclase [Myxococcales bacterium]
MREGLNTTPLDIDGSRGEGGGQILRTSLALSMITGRPIAMRNIRAGRAKPGLRRQHLACVLAAQELCGATVHGATVGSKYLEFTPGPVRDGELSIDIGTAGSTTLVVQTILVPALAAKRTLRAVVHGGTHNPMAPPFEFLARVFLPHLHAMGAVATLTLDRHGFAGGGSIERDERHRGQLTLSIAPSELRPIEIVETGEVTARRATVVLARLPTHVAERELAIVREQLGFTAAECEIREISEGGTGNILLLEIERAHARELVTGFGEKGTRAELVASRACDELASFLAAEVPVGEHLADQLLLPFALAGGGRFRCAPLSRHATTNIETIQMFLDVPIRVEPHGDAELVTIGRN